MVAWQIEFGRPRRFTRPSVIWVLPGLQRPERSHAAVGGAAPARRPARGRDTWCALLHQASSPSSRGARFFTGPWPICSSGSGRRTSTRRHFASPEASTRSELAPSEFTACPRPSADALLAPYLRPGLRLLARSLPQARRADDGALRSATVY